MGRLPTVTDVFGRRLHLNKGRIFMKQLLAMLVMIVLLGFFGWWLGPGLMSDYSARNQTLIPVTDMTITEAECTSKLFFISFCDIKAEGSHAVAKEEIHYLLFGNMGGKSVGLLRSPESPQVLTTNIGIDYFWNRVVAFAVFMGIFFAGLVGGVIGMRSEGRGESLAT